MDPLTLEGIKRAQSCIKSAEQQIRYYKRRLKQGFCQPQDVEFWQKDLAFWQDSLEFWQKPLEGGQL